MATSSRSAMVRTSIQACGTATTTLALPKPRPSISSDALVGVRDALAHQVLAGDAEMDRAARQLRGDLAGREIGDLDIVEAGDGAAIIARAARLRRASGPARAKKASAFSCRRPLEGTATNEGRGHARSCAPATPLRSGASTQTEKPTAGSASPSRAASSARHSGRRRPAARRRCPCACSSKSKPV